MPIKVSIITPTFNSHQFIEETILSIQNQTYQNWELLITDDCSTDNTWNLLNDYAAEDIRIKIFQLNKNSGPGIARNNSIKHAKGRFIAFCDSDDLWESSKLEKHLKYHLNNNLALTYSYYKVINESGTCVGKMNAPNCLTYFKMLLNDFIGCLTVVYDTDLIGKVYMPALKKRQDWALWLKILKTNNSNGCVKEYLASYRKRENSISSKKISLFKYNYSIYKNIEKFNTFFSILLIIQYPFTYFLKMKKYYKKVQR